MNIGNCYVKTKPSYIILLKRSELRLVGRFLYFQKSTYKLNKVIGFLGLKDR